MNPAIIIQAHRMQVKHSLLHFQCDLLIVCHCHYYINRDF